MNMLDMAKMMGKLREMQEAMKTAQSNLENIHATGESGGGMVTATANGKKKLLKLQIEPGLVNADDREMMQDLIVAAINAALENAESKAAEELRKSTDGLMPNIPGLDLSKLF